MTNETQDPDHLEPALRFEVVPYRAEGGYSMEGLALALSLSLVGGLVAGAVASWIGQWFYLIVLFPAGMACVVGLGGGFGAHWGKLRNPRLAFLVGIAGGCLAAATMHYLNFRQFLVQANKNLPGALDLQLSPNAFAHFIDQSAEMGVQIMGRPGQNGINLGYWGTYIYWLCEIAIIAVSAGVMVSHVAAEPFCSECRTWKATKRLGKVNVPRDLALDAINSGEIIRLASLDLGPGAGVLNLDIAVCPNCGSAGTVDLRFKQITVNTKGQESLLELAHVTYPGASLPGLEAMFEGNPEETKDNAASPVSLAPANVSEQIDRIDLAPIDKKHRNVTWALILCKGEVLLVDAENQVIASIPHKDARGRFVFPSFWESVRNLGVLTDNGKVTWFKPDKAVIKKIKGCFKT